MRASPDGLRSVVLDSVAPIQVLIHDTLALPHAEAIQGIFDACTADAKCAAAASGTGLVNEFEAALKTAALTAMLTRQVMTRWPGLRHWPPCWTRASLQRSSPAGVPTTPPLIWS